MGTHLRWILPVAVLVGCAVTAVDEEVVPEMGAELSPRTEERDVLPDSPFAVIARDSGRPAATDGAVEESPSSMPSSSGGSYASPRDAGQADAGVSDAGPKDAGLRDAGTAASGTGATAGDAGIDRAAMPGDGGHIDAGGSFAADAASDTGVLNLPVDSAVPHVGDASMAWDGEACTARCGGFRHRCCEAERLLTADGGTLNTP